MAQPRMRVDCIKLGLVLPIVRAPHLPSGHLLLRGEEQKRTFSFNKTFSLSRKHLKFAASMARSSNRPSVARMQKRGMVHTENQTVATANSLAGFQSTRGHVRVEHEEAFGFPAGRISCYWKIWQFHELRKSNDQ